METKRYRDSFIGLFFVTLLPLLIILVSMRVWEMDWSVPYAFSEDPMLGLPIIKSMCKDGLKGLFFAQSMGAPEISALIETPFLDLNFALEVLVLNLFTTSATTIYYLFYFLTFPLAGITMFLLLRHISKKLWFSVFFSVAYAITPYHFKRGLFHMTLSNYYIVPLAIFLALLIAEETFKGVIPERYMKSKWKAVFMYLAALILGMGNVYYAFFGLMCMGMSLLVKMIREKRVDCLWKEAVSMYMVVLGVALGLIPKILYTLQNGGNEMASIRSAMESELYGLKVMQLILPCDYNRIGILAQLNAKYTANAININENVSASLGFIATVGFFATCIWLIWYIARGNQNKNDCLTRRMTLFSLMMLTLILYCLSGGFGSIVSYFITPMIRCFNRSSILIACLCLTVCLVGLDYLDNKIQKKRYRFLEYVALGIVGLFVLYSEVPVSASGWQNEAKNQHAILVEFFDEVEASLPEESMIYQLPFSRFPEAGPLYNMKDYELGLGPVYTDNLHWSYGAMKGRNQVSESLYVDGGMSEAFVQGIKDAGFSAVYIDTKGFEDGGVAINQFYSETLGLTPIVSEDGWLYFYVLDKGDING